MLKYVLIKYFKSATYIAATFISSRNYLFLLIIILLLLLPSLISPLDATPHLCKQQRLLSAPRVPFAAACDPALPHEIKMISATITTSTYSMPPSHENDARLPRQARDS